MKLLYVLSRFLIAQLFLFSALGKIADFQGTTEYMKAYGMPAVGFFAIGAIILELAGGLSILLGYMAKLGALLLIAFIVPATLIFHTNLQDQMQVIMLMKNLSITGALLFIALEGSGPASLDSPCREGGDS